MNTQSHAILTFYLVRRFLNEKTKRLKGLHAVLFTGAVTPDIPIYLFFLWYTVIQPTPQHTMWNELYFRRDWQLFFSPFHSFPLWATSIVIFSFLKKMPAVLFSLSAFLSSVEDFLLHHDDGHAHFFPFSDYRFASPVSYWDPAHYGKMASLVEIGLVLAASIWIFQKLKSGWGKALLVVTVLTLITTNTIWALLFDLY